MVVHVWVQMHHDRHAVLICHTKDLLKPANVIRVIQIHIGISEVELQTKTEFRVMRTARDFGNCVFSERVNSAEREETVGVSLGL
jgi:hypothetical protein